MDIKTTLDNIKAIKEIADSTQNIELKSLIVDLKEEILNLRQENLDLKQQLSQKVEHNMVFENKVYWDLKKMEQKTDHFVQFVGIENIFRLELGMNIMLIQVEFIDIVIIVKMILK